jgi:hypothetical protein
VAEQFLFHTDPRDVADEGDELSIQAKFIGRMKTLAPTVKIVATPNGGNRTAWEKMRAKREGLVKGWPDVTAYWSNGLDASALPGLALLEFKDRKGQPSVEQIEALNWLHRHGFRCGIFRSVDTAVEFLRAAGAPFLIERKVA